MRGQDRRRKSGGRKGESGNSDFVTEKKETEEKKAQRIKMLKRWTLI